VRGINSGGGGSNSNASGCGWAGVQYLAYTRPVLLAVAASIQYSRAGKGPYRAVVLVKYKVCSMQYHVVSSQTRKNLLFARCYTVHSTL
jgi:hypothetical protein